MADFDLTDLSLLSWSLVDLPELGRCRELQDAAVYSMAVRPKDWLGFANAVLGVVWAWHFAGLLSQCLWRRASHVLRETARDVDRERGSDRSTSYKSRSVEPGSYREPWVLSDMCHVLVIAKPAGWEVYDGNAEKQLKHFLQNLEYGQPILSDQVHGCGFLHRLDVPSSGLVLAATTYEAWYDLQLQLVSGKMQREYQVLAHGFARRKQIDAHLRWHEDAVSAGAVGKPSKTLLEVLGFLLRPSTLRSFSMLHIRIVTGRKHQIRSHLAWTGHPSVTDGKYASKASLVEDLGFCPRNFLHRCRLRWRQGDAHQDLAPDLAAVLARLKPKDWRGQQAQQAWNSGAKGQGQERALTSKGVPFQTCHAKARGVYASWLGPQSWPGAVASSWSEVRIG